jgi:hypothetical protein
MERGNSKRPLIIVPNDSILKQWVETIFETIPDAKVNVLGNLGKDYDLSKFDNKNGRLRSLLMKALTISDFQKVSLWIFLLSFPIYQKANYEV